MTKRIVVVASGRGSNFQAIIGALQRGNIPAECVALVTDNPEAYAIEPYETKNGETRYRPREMGTGAYDPRVRHGLNGVRRVVAAIRTRVVIIGGVEVTIG